MIYNTDKSKKLIQKDKTIILQNELKEPTG